MPINLSVNGKATSVAADPNTPLLWVIRDQLALTGTKFGCGVGVCGACTVLVNGAAVRSCQTTLAAAAGASVTTVEGLSPDRSHPLQKAWIANEVPQCGYCQSGMLMSAAGLLNANPKPNDAAIEAALVGNICRCGTYQRVKAAVKAAAKV